MKKDLQYYLNLRFKIEIIPIPDSEGSGFRAYFPEIGNLAILGDGPSPEQALVNLQEEKRVRFEYYLQKGILIPEPNK